MVKIIILVLIFWGPVLSFAQVGIPFNSSGSVCECNPPCGSLDVELNCLHGTISTRKDCNCCKICILPEGEPCTDVNVACDEELGLVCSSGVCKAPICKVDSDCPSDRFCSKDLCRDPCPRLQPCINTMEGSECVTIDHQPRCQCPEGLVANHEVNACLEIQANSSSPSLDYPRDVRCNVEGQLKEVGESFYSPYCEQKCVCSPEGIVSCDAYKCPPGLFPVGSSKDKSLCIEIKSAPLADECCVVLACSSSVLESIQLPNAEDKRVALSQEHLPQKSGRDISEPIVQSISESEHYERLKELEAILANNSSVIEETQLSRDKNRPLKSPTETENVNDKEKHQTGTSRPMESSTIAEEMITHSVTATEESTSTAIMLEGQFDDQSPLDGLDDLPSTQSIIYETTSQASFNANDSGNVTTSPSVVIPSVTTSDTTTPDNLSETDVGLPIKDEESVTSQEPVMLMKEEREEKALHNVSLLVQNDDHLMSMEGVTKPSINSEKEHKAMTHPEKFTPKSRLLHLKTSTHNSTTLELPSASGGVLHYKESRADIEAMKLVVEDGQTEVTVTGLNPNTRYTFKWAGTGSDATKGKMEAKTEDGCWHHGVSYGVGAKWHQGCQTTCYCRDGGSNDCRPRCLFLAGDVKDEQCQEHPSVEDPECCIEYKCEKKDNSVLDTPPADASLSDNKGTEPKLIVTATSHNSITVAWDDFRADYPDRGYVTEYREAHTGVIDHRAEIPWMKKETLKGQPPPTMTIGNLKPSTVYEVRVGIYSQPEERRLIDATETITVPTQPGCLYGNTSFPIGEFYQGCEEKCYCSKDGSVKCAGRCTIPYFRKGSFANDPLCSEEQEEGDECCVLVMCAHGGSREGAEYDQCANTVCGKNAECVTWTKITEVSGDKQLPQPGSCICKRGYSGDPKDHVIGCTVDPAIVDNSNNCMFLGRSYSPGDEFFDGCSYRCTCSSQREIGCQPRCQYAANDSLEDAATNNSCSYLPDPEDECCKIKVCNFTSGADVSSLQSPNLNFDGCVYKNVTYTKNEEFTYGCDSKCLCMGFGDITCSPRCPPMKGMPEMSLGIKCETLADPEDECCNITLCDDSTLDVMRANVTAEDVLKMGGNGTDETHFDGPNKDMNETKMLLMNMTDEIVELQENDTMKNMTMNEDEMLKNMTMDKESMNKNMTTHEDMMKDTIEDDMKNMTRIEDMIEIMDGDGMMKNMTIGEDMTNMDKNDMKNMTMNEDGTIKMTMNLNDTVMNTDFENDEKMVNATIDMDLNTDSENTTEGMTSNETIVISLENDMMPKHENHPHKPEEDAVMFEVSDDKDSNLTYVPIDEDIRSSTGDPLLHHMESGKEKSLIMDPLAPDFDTSHPDYNEDNVTNTESAFETDLPLKRPRFEDTVFPHLEIIEILPMDSSTVKVTVRATQDIISSLLSSESQFLVLSYSPDSLMWKNRTISVDNVDVKDMYDIYFEVSDLEANEAYQFKVYYKDIASMTMKASLPTSGNQVDPNVIPSKGMCEFGEKMYAPGDKFYDGCVRFCQCTHDVKVHCEEIRCPDRSGLDIMDPGCLEWEKDPTFVAKPPKCCGSPLKCSLHVDHLACNHMNQKFQHLDFIPKELVGCDLRCQCIRGKLDCESLCGPVAATPPFHLPCEIHEARLVSGASFPCCRDWQCLNDTISESEHLLHPIPEDDMFNPSIIPPVPKPKLTLMDLKDITETSVRIIFSIADIFVGLPGGIYLRFIEGDPSQPDSVPWESVVIHEEGVIMDRAKWEYVKTGLQPGTNYTMQLALLTHLKGAESVSERFSVSTLPLATTPLPPLELDAELSVSEIRNTSAKISWKRFNDLELQYIDGIRVRFWPVNKKFPLEGPMLHRGADSDILRDLIPDTKYMVDLFFIQHEGVTSSITNTKQITFMTLPKPKDKYDFNITIESGEINNEGVQIVYSGTPEPEGKFVNVYRVVYTTDGDSRDSQKFKVPKNRNENFIKLTELKPDVLYSVWLEAYLTNGSKKKSNVITIKTSPGQLPTPAKSEIGELTEKGKEEKEGGTYYSAFVAVVILVTLACIIILGLVFLLFRRQNQAKIHMNSSKNNATYDNPSYKASENQNYAMELNGLKNTTNGASREEP